MSSEEASQKLEHSNIPIKRPRKKKCSHSHDTGHGVATAIGPSGKCCDCGEQVQKPYETSPSSEISCRFNSIKEEQISYDKKCNRDFYKFLLYVTLGLGLIVFHVWRVGSVGESAYLTGFNAGYESIKM